MSSNIRNFSIITPIVAARPLLENPQFSTVGSASLADLLSDTGKLKFSRPLSNNARSQGRA